MSTLRTGRPGRGLGLCVLAGVAGCAVFASHAAERSVGLAYARGTDQLVYREVHLRFSEGGFAQRLVLYECANGNPFARKLVRDIPSADAPDFDFEDARDGYREGVRPRGGGREVYVQAGRQAPLQQRPLPVENGGVIDAGVDAYVRGHWRELAARGPVSVPFLVPSRFAFLPFKLSVPYDDLIGSHPVTRVHMRLQAWYGFALPAIDLAYDRAGTHLMQFEGPGTIRRADGRNQEVRIVFPADQRVGVPDSEVGGARTAALVSSCDGAAGRP